MAVVKSRLELLLVYEVPENRNRLLGMSVVWYVWVVAIKQV